MDRQDKDKNADRHSIGDGKSRGQPAVDTMKEARQESENATDVRMVFIDRSNIAVYKDVLLSIKGDVGRETVELVRLDAHVALLANLCIY